MKTCYQKVFKRFFIFLILILLSNGISASAKGVVVIPLIENHSSNIDTSNVIELATTYISPSKASHLVIVTPSADSGGYYTVPTGKYLVITSVIIFPQAPGEGTLKVYLMQNSASREYWVVPNSQPTQLSFSPGMLIAPAASLEISNHSTSAGNIRVSFFGYETNQN